MCIISELPKGYHLHGFTAPLNAHFMIRHKPRNITSLYRGDSLSQYSSTGSIKYLCSFASFSIANFFHQYLRSRCSARKVC